MRTFSAVVALFVTMIGFTAPSAFADYVHSSTEEAKITLEVWAYEEGSSGKAVKIASWSVSVAPGRNIRQILELIPIGELEKKCAPAPEKGNVRVPNPRLLGHSIVRRGAEKKIVANSQRGTRWQPADFQFKSGDVVEVREIWD